MNNKNITQYIYESSLVCSKVCLFRFLITQSSLNSNTDILTREALSKKLDITFIDKDLCVDNDINQKLKSLLELHTVDGFENVTSLKYKPFYNFVHNYFCVNKKWIDIEKYVITERISKTLKALQDITIEVILNAMFQYKNCVVKADILIRNKNGWIIVSITTPNNQLQNPLFVSSLQYQYYILKNFITINDIQLCMLNNNFIYKGRGKYENLIETKTLIDNYLDFFNYIKNNQTSFENGILELTNWLAQDLSERSLQEQIFKAKFCFETLNNDAIPELYCPHIFGEYLANKQTILNLYKMNKKNKITLFYKQYPHYCLSDLVTNKQLLASLNANHNIQIDCSWEDVFFINPQKHRFLREEVNKYKPPIYFFDFETFSLLVPKFKNTKPWSQIVFQYSIHVITDLDDLNQDKYIHFEYLVEKNDQNSTSDFRLELLQNLMHDLFKFGKGVYVCYYKSFEKQILEDLKINFPQHAHQIDKVLGSLLDLKDFFNFNIYHPRFKGSFSLKDVYPVFATTQTTYQDLELIQNGMQASDIFSLFYNNIIKQTDWDKYYAIQLKEYCKLDTLAMVIIFKGLLKLLAPILC